ncbi:DUF1127 domain-containing protein [Methylovirgula sp. 4M-Z18]|uniref:DUF1127 domain-containing protein n=1 Tax=Methylovirgula sp. 4M-Z18 TaxID=2293567 RepID=UPI000E2F3DF1|nr:DUF1127 domain-containing protein [Methylovirgula sp. 4M-Z18]
MAGFLRKICNDWLAARQRRANMEFLLTLSDETLQDIGVERSEIGAKLGEATAAEAGASMVWSVRWPGMRALTKAWRHYGFGGYSLR